MAAPLPGWRIPLAATCVIAAGMLAMAAPGIAAARAERQLHADLIALARSSKPAMHLERELEARTALLREFTRFDGSSRSMTLSLAAVTRAIRPPSMLLSFHADSTGGTLVVLTPGAAGLVAMLGNDPEVMSPRILGPVAPQSLPPGPMPNLPTGVVGAAAPVTPPRTERVTIRFLWRRANQ